MHGYQVLKIRGIGHGQTLKQNSATKSNLFGMEKGGSLDRLDHAIMSLDRVFCLFYAAYASLRRILSCPACGSAASHLADAVQMIRHALVRALAVAVPAASLSQHQPALYEFLYLHSRYD